MASLEEIRDGWDRVAREDAMFNILTVPEYAGGWPPDEFFATGEREIDEALAYLDEKGLRGPGRDMALDFGCGVGRLTRALARHYETAYGIDASREMVGQAQELTPGPIFLWNSRPDLWRLDQAFDLIYSAITLQHLPPTFQRAYIVEFFRVIKDDGIAVFQMVSGERFDNGHLSMYGVAPDTVHEWVTEAGGEVLDVEETHHSGEASRPSWRYTARRA